MPGLLFGLVLLASGTAQAGEPKSDVSAGKVNEILECARANAPEKTFKQLAVFVTSTASGADRSVETRILGERGKEGLRLNLRVTAPAATAGTTVLVREREGQDDMRIFLPATGRAQAVTGSMAATKLLGTDFSYQDLKQMFGAMLDGNSEYLGESEQAGRAAYQIKLIPAPEEAAPYNAAVVSFDKQTCVPLVAEFTSADGEVLRSLLADTDSLKTEKNRHYAQRYKLVDLVSNTQTTVDFSVVEYDDKLNRQAFHPNSFKSVE